jgi:hypothetical protein
MGEVSDDEPKGIQIELPMIGLPEDFELVEYEVLNPLEGASEELPPDEVLVLETGPHGDELGPPQM